MPTKFVNILETSKLRVRGRYFDSVWYVLLHFLKLRLYENLATGPYMTVRVTRGALVAHRYIYEPPRCRTSQYNSQGFYFPLRISVERSCWLLYSMVLDWRAIIAEPMLSYWTSRSYPFYLLLLFHSSSFFLWVGIVVLGIRTDRVSIALSRYCFADPFQKY